MATNNDKKHAEPGHRQSPINIELKKAEHDPALRPCGDQPCFRFDHNPTDCVTITNKGTTWSICLKHEPDTKLTGSHLPGIYRLAEIHAHWGTGSNDGSEHLINGKGYAGEIHFVHYNEAYGLVDAAKNHGDGLAVLGILLEESNEDNPALEPLIKALHHVQYKGQTGQFSHGFDLAKLLPRDKEFCTYLGSLTTPPYTECVVWTVFVHPIHISRRQLEQFRSLNSCCETETSGPEVKILHNARTAQELGQRKIRSSFATGSSA